MIIRAEYEGKDIVITTGTNKPDEITSFVLNPEDSLEASFKIDELTHVGNGAYGHSMNGVVTNRDLVSALGDHFEFDVKAVEPPIPVFNFPPRVAT